MFGELKKYMNTNFFNEHPSFYLYTPNGNYKVDVISADTDDALSSSYNAKFNDLNDYQRYIEKIRLKSRYSTDISVNYILDRTITLYSCSHESGSKTERYFIHGKIISLSE